MKQKGFTLIELLAVIVILAVIALIATPMILNVIDTAKRGSAESAALGYVEAVEKAVMLSQFETTTYTVASGDIYEVDATNSNKLVSKTVSSGSSAEIIVSFKGEAPKAGSTVTFGAGGSITDASLTFTKIIDKVVTYDADGADITTVAA